MNSRIKDYTGFKYENLTVISMDGFHITKSGNKHTKWKCKCSCGNFTSILVGSIGKTKSCGCLNHKPKNLIHGGRYSKAYSSWRSMKRRCYQETNKVFHNYGGRGIKVCDRWLESFENFYNDMGNCPNNYSLDRIDSNGNYTPENCRWSTNIEQQRNKRSNKIILDLQTGIFYTSTSEFLENHNISKSTFKSHKNGLTKEDKFKNFIYV